MLAKLPAAKPLTAFSSSLSPMPAKNVPEMTVTFSSPGCQCAGIL